MNNTDVANEGYIFTKKDIQISTEDFYSGKSNVLLITGLSRSGKTTLGTEIANKYHAKLISIDYFEDFDCLKATDKVIIKLVNDYLKTPIGQEYYNIIISWGDSNSNFDFSKYMSDCVRYILQYCSKNPDTKYVVEGLQIYEDCDYREMIKYPIIIKGTSMATSFYRRSNHSLSKLMDYFKSESKLEAFIKNIKKQNVLESSINIESFENMEIAEEGLFSMIRTWKESHGITAMKWKDLLLGNTNFVGMGKSATITTLPKKTASKYIGVKIRKGMIEIHGINFKLLQTRIQRFYVDKSIANIFVPKYNALSYAAFERKSIQRKQIKIDYMYTPEFFALELTKLFAELGKRFRDKTYKAMAETIYEESWLSVADANVDNVPYLNTQPLNNLTLDLKPYQIEFIEKYPKLKAQLNLNGYILAFEQGLGKTLTAIGLSECVHADHVYIVCPNSLKENWALELKKYYKKYQDDSTLWKDEVFICNQKSTFFDPNTTKFIITNNESINKMFPYVMGGKNMLILDESHNFRNLESKRCVELIKLRDELKCVDNLIMSGTPIKATPNELVPAMLMIDPTFTMEAAKIFTKAFKLKDSIGTSLVQARFGKVMWRKEKDVLDKLPEKIIDEISVEISNKSKYVFSNVLSVVMERFAEIYAEGEKGMLAAREPFFEMADKYAQETVRNKNRFHDLVQRIVRVDYDSMHEIDLMFVEKYVNDAKANILNRDESKRFDDLVKGYLRYRGHCKGLAFGEIMPKYRRDMFIEMYAENAETFRDMIEENVKKTIIFSQFKDAVKYIYNDLNDHDIGAVMITGDIKNRMPILEEFKNNDNVKVLVATSQTLGTGVTLVEASQMFFFGPPWRSADFEQCCDRIHRIGQTDDVHIYTVTLNTGNDLNLSTRMDNILRWSKQMTDAAIHKNTSKEDLEHTEFEKLLTASESTISEFNFAMESVAYVEDYNTNDKLNCYGEIDPEVLDVILEYNEYFRGIEVKTLQPIPKNYVIDKFAVDSPLGSDGKFRNMKFSKLGNAVFANPDNNTAPVRFDYVNEDGHEYWRLISTVNIKKGTKLFYNPNDGDQMFCDPDRV